MREIKLRAWNITAKKWDYFVPNNILTYIQTWQLHVLDGDEFRLYTGLKDKNGVEIYEGDVLNFEIWHGGPEHHMYENKMSKEGKEVNWFKPHIVFWDEEYCRFEAEWRMGNQINLALTKHIIKLVEVIGNVHESPELLEEK